MVKLNQHAFDFARKLIREGKVLDDKHGAWGKEQPSAQQENDYLADHSWEDYSGWYLGVNPDDNPETKEAYEFPYGNFREVVRAGLIAAEDRAGQYGHKDIEDAAKKLIAEIDGE